MLTFRHAAAAAAVTVALVAGSASAGVQDDVFTVHNLVGDAAGLGARADAALVNGWGLSAGPTTPWWVSDNGTNTSTLYNGSGAKQALTVSVPGAPTGTVFNGAATDFVVSQNGKSGAARFLFATEGGQILGWSPTVNGTLGDPRRRLVGERRRLQGPHDRGRPAVRDRLPQRPRRRVRRVVQARSRCRSPTRSCRRATRRSGSRRSAGSIFVTYAKQDAAKKDDVPGGGAGYVDQFTPDGQLVARVAAAAARTRRRTRPGGSRWRRRASASSRGDLLIGNFGNGRISAYQDRGGGKWVYKGQLRRGDQTLITIDGLWAIAFGNGAAGGPTTSLYFAAGPGGEAHGLFGSITAG